MKIIPISILLALTALVSSCSIPEGKIEAELIAKGFFEKRISEGGTGDDNYYSNLFWEATPPEKWDKTKGIIYGALGDLKSYNLETWNSQSKAGFGSNTGLFVSLVYVTEYQSGSGKEVLVFHRKNKEEEMKIVSHRFFSEQIENHVYQKFEQGTGEKL